MTPQEMEKIRRIRYLELMRANDTHPLHGTHTGYGYGCRCERCKAARAEYEQGRRGKPRAWRWNYPAHESVALLQGKGMPDRGWLIDRAEKILEEACELYAAIRQGEGEERVLEELHDCHHACETAERAWTARRNFEARNAVVEKNRKRGYYGEGETR